LDFPKSHVLHDFFFLKFVKAGSSFKVRLFWSKEV
jgi:hypothetical protein